MNLQSLSNMFTTAVSGLPMITPLSDEDWSMVTLKSSFCSDTPSSVIGMSKEALTLPAGIVILCCPEP